MVEELKVESFPLLVSPSGGDWESVLCSAGSISPGNFSGCGEC